MKVLSGIGSLPFESGSHGSAVTIGKFDGVHAGHRAVIKRLKDIASAKTLTAVVVTFDRHPLAVLAPEKCPPFLISGDQKLRLLAETGVDCTLVLEFTRDLANLPPEVFAETVLVDGLHARHVLVGRDFRFGAHGAGDVTLLTSLGARFGFVVDLIEDVTPDGARRVSSTWIRELLASGDVRAAGELLGHIPTVRGEVVHGAARGRELGFPTANLSADCQGLIPADGVYAGWLTDGPTRYPAAVSVGNNPTFDGVAQRQVEAYVLDRRDLDLYGHIVEVSFVDRIRGMVAFTGIDPLIVQMRADVDKIRPLLSDSTRR